MNKLEFLHWLQDNRGNLGRISVDISHESFSPYTLGCFKNSNNEYVVYENDEHSHYTVLTTPNQDKAFDELKSMVLFEIRNNRGYY